MAITNTALTADTALTDVASAATASITPASNQLVLAWVYNARAAGAASNIPTLTGNGLTWVSVDSFEAFMTPTFRIRVSLYRALGNAPTSGAVTIDFAGQVQHAIAWSISMFNLVKITGTNGADAIVQSVRGSVEDPAALATSVTATLAAFSGAGNATAGGFAVNSGDVGTVGSGFSLINSIAATDGTRLLSEWRADNSTTVNVSWTTPNYAAGIAVEIAAAIAAPSIPGGQVIARVQSMGRIATRPQGIVM